MIEEKKIGVQKVLEASFEQSLNLADEDTFALRKTWEDKQELNKQKKRKPPGKIKIVILRVVMLLFIWLFPLLSNYLYRNPDEYAMAFNFLPKWLCWVLMGIFLMIVYGYKYSLKQNWEQMRFYNGQWLQLCYALLIFVVSNLFFASLLTAVLPIYTIIAIYIAILMFEIMILRSHMKGISTILYAPGGDEATINVFMKRVVKTFIKLSGICAMPYLIFQYAYPEAEQSIKGNMILVTALVIVGNLILLMILTYTVFTVVIQGYYRNKYAEEYRKREGQTQIEWYGEKYFNKYIKGTEKEERNDDRDKEIITNG